MPLGWSVAPVVKFYPAVICPRSVLQGGYISGLRLIVYHGPCGTCMPYLSLDDRTVCVDAFVASKPINLTNTSAIWKFRRRIAEPCTVDHSLCSTDDTPPIDCVQGHPLYQQDGDNSLNNGAVCLQGVANLTAPCPTAFQGSRNVDTAASTVSRRPMGMLH